jgi:hypothetical protein
VQANTSIDWDVGMQAAIVNNSARETMAQLAAWRNLISYGTVSGGTTGGSSNAFTLTCSPTIGAYALGQRYLFLANHSISGSATLNVDGLGAKTLKYRNAALGSGDIVSGDLVLTVYDGADMEMVTLPRSLGNTQGFAVKDANFTLQDESDTSKQAQFQLSGISTATTRSYTLPNASTILVGDDTTQTLTLTLTGKTLTSPTLNTPTINTPTITTPTLNGTPTIGSASVWRSALGVQALDAELTAIAGLASAADKGLYFTSAGTADIFTLTSTGRTFLGAANVAAQQTALELEPGEDVQEHSARLDAIAGVSGAANNKGIYLSGTDTVATFDLTSLGRTLVGGANTAAMQSTLGLGDLAVLDTVNNGNWYGAALAVGNGATGATTEAGARSNHGINAASTSAAGLVELATSAETQAGSATTLAVTPSGMFSAFTSSFGANDMYFRIPGGAIVQCGVRSTSNTNYTVTFPLEFPTKCFAFVCTPKGDGTDTGASSTTQSVKIVEPYGDPSTTGINIGIFGEEGDEDTFQDNNSTTFFWWIAVGH